MPSLRLPHLDAGLCSPEKRPKTHHDFRGPADIKQLCRVARSSPKSSNSTESSCHVSPSCPDIGRRPKVSGQLLAVRVVQPSRL